jgi:hypothetical protein
MSATHGTVIVAILAGLTAAIGLSWRPSGRPVTSTGAPAPARPGTTLDGVRPNHF